MNKRAVKAGFIMSSTGRSMLSRAWVALLIAVLLLPALIGLFPERLYALNSQGGKNFQFLGYRYLNERQLQLWFDKNLPQSNADPAQFRIYSGAKAEGEGLKVASLSSSADKNQSIAGMPAGSSYVLELSAGETFSKGRQYTVVLSGTLVANNKVSLGAYRSNEDTVFTFSVPVSPKVYTGAGDPVIVHSLQDGATGVPVETGLSFILDRPAAHPEDVAKGIVLKENGTALPLDSTLDADRLTGAVCYAAQFTDDGTFFFLPLSGSGGTVAYDLGFDKEYTLQIPDIRTVDGQDIPAHSVKFRTTAQDVPPPMNGTIDAKWDSGNLQLSWSSLAYTTGYHLYSSSDQYWGFKKESGAPISGNAYTVTGIIPGSSRYYRLTGVNDAGEGGISTSIHVSVSASGEAAVEVGTVASSQGTQSNSLLNAGADGVPRVDAAKAEALIRDATMAQLEADVTGFSESNDNAKEVRVPAATLTLLKSAGKPFVLKDSSRSVLVPSVAVPDQYAWTIGLWKPSESSLPSKPKDTQSRQVIALKSLSGDASLYDIQSPITISLPIPEGTVDPAKLVAYALDADEGRWEYAGGDVTDTGITFRTDKYTAYLLVETGKSFKDLTGHWAKQAIEVMAGRQIVNGTSADRFSPQRPVTRAEFAVFLTRLLKLQTSAGDSGFKDVKAGDWFAGEAKAAAAAGIIQGDSGKFRPGDRITRQEMAVMAMRAYKQSGGGAVTGQMPFTDKSKIGAWALENVGEAYALGLIHGMPDGRFGGEQEATRAEAVTMLNQLMHLLHL
ncbi:S-layer homology domain-containing protein [Paenibacillus sp. HN-1]|uniref:S-layer homology domain-containing protein n=1 Tax=Paenibacillus TaxID=44249 RepID=UPI001CA939A0|nr:MULTISPECIES: S-layer homology domain-containing protein [Paenibacillus]MBY9081479.1 S-layer homology domain-containing protein [Paenibacillus sp. CGMCC 1.18879]MBY9084999.1 S-layer homology domain-containing protein [Paenibacillus sinensis]